MDLTDRWQEYLSFDIVKVWDDADHEDLRPDTLTADLIGMVNGGRISEESVELSAEEGWKKTVTGLPRWYYVDGVAS